VGDRSTAFAFALSENIAAFADQDPQTAAFRTAHLPDGLVHLDQVDAWITQRSQEQSGETRQARVRIPVGWLPNEPLSSTGAEVFVEQLHYVLPEQVVMAWSERITLDVHAAATPDEVAEAYRAARLRHGRLTYWSRSEGAS